MIEIKDSAKGVTIGVSSSGLSVPVPGSLSELASYLELARENGITVGCINPAESLFLPLLVHFWSLAKPAPSWIQHGASGSLPPWIIDLGYLFTKSEHSSDRLVALLNPTVEDGVSQTAESILLVWMRSLGMAPPSKRVEATDPAEATLPAPAPRPTWLFPPTETLPTDTAVAKLIVAPLPGAIANGPAGGWKSIRKDKRETYHYHQGANSPFFSRIVGIAFASAGGHVVQTFQSETEAITSSLGLLNRARNEGEIYVPGAAALRYMVAVRATFVEADLGAWFIWRKTGTDWLQDTRKLFSPFFDAVSIPALAVAHGYAHNVYDIETPLVYAAEPDFEEEARRNILTLFHLVNHERTTVSPRSSFTSAAA